MNGGVGGGVVDEGHVGGVFQGMFVVLNNSEAHSHQRNLNMRSKNCTQINHQAPLASLTECYKLVNTTKTKLSFLD